jgi:serine/threonine-protein kinase
MDLQIGSVVGDYQVVGILGAGGMGKVFKVRNVISDRIEALKVLLPDLANEADLADRFMREIKVTASLEHPNIAQLRTALRVGNQLFMVMEFVEGETIEQRMKSGPLPVGQAADYIGQVLAALDYAHAQGVIHRDIKPANMMLTPTGVVKLMDFGIAKGAGDRRLTMTGTTMGSLYYMSPEQIQGAATLDARADLYSVGVSLYELVTGKRPFDGDSQFAIMSAHLEKTPVPPITIDPTLPQPLNDAILMSVAKDPNNRFQTAGAFRNALSSVAAAHPVDRMIATTAAAAPGQPTDARQAQYADKPAPLGKPRSKRLLWMGIGAVATAAVVVGVIQFAPWKGTKAALDPQPKTVQQQVVQQPAVQPPVQQQIVDQPAVQPPVQQPVLQPRDSRPPDRAAQTQGQTTTKQSAVQPPPAQQPATQPVVQQPAAQPPPMQQIPQQPAADLAAKRKELQEARDQIVLLGSRAASVQSSLDNLRRSNAASGLGVRADMQEASSLMNANLQGANDAIRAGDAASATTFMTRAERQIEKLEKFFNH